MIDSTYIKKSAQAEGFDLVGVTYPRDFEVNRVALEQWVAHGCADNLDYMKRYADQRFNPANLMDGTRSIVVCAINYKNFLSLGQRESLNPKVASYAIAKDYHKVVRSSLKALLRRLQANYPDLQGRCCVDTAPLLEKQLAVEAGLGWIGRQSLLITPEHGSFVILGVLLIDSEVDIYDKPLNSVGCGSCRRCVDSCPSGALLENRTLDSRCCISALTVECDNSSGGDLHGWIFGCDECQSCCPYNQKTPLSSNVAMQPIFAPPTAQEWRAMTQEEFATQLGSTPMKRGGLERLQRNIKD